ncbi:hypothetical protein DL766_007136 [Monosporascus sp. MC13-8B]|uniref:C3H1-type domain-containing protein n=1 Tax=Monosporascus cannonballus TaxID=155416 RepID=A0ABY0H0L5_9PEZI|nr:hypothetical protein DL762_006928 [Monosporascus cannonballus]RYO92441.1 hypothetical protein DL763_004668 [Monosporascus cannonballus]RYP25107.1 hypothetical protein DL766_007136 [Monosporascus sp. MC13-8B]
MAMGGIMDFLQRYQEYDIQRNRTHEFIKDLMLYAEHIESSLRQENNALHQELRNTRLDLDDAAQSRRDLQQRLLDIEARMGYVSQDNDNLKFREEFMRQGLEGGKKAANALRQAIALGCRDADETEIIAKVVANLNGLSKAMKRDGCVDSENDVKEFMLGFTQAKASFDFVDVGHGKERADSKIRETTRWNLRNYNCKQIVLGVSHDAGYAPFLDDLTSDASNRQRITILEGYPTVREIESTGVEILSLKTIFRGDKLVNRTSLTPSVASASSASGSISYATITQKASPPPQLTLPISLKCATPARGTKTQPLWNPGPRGLDPPIPINQVALDAIKKRKDSNKLCNNHFLRGPCAKGDECCFVHDYNPTKDEINAIALLARVNPCTNGQDCDVENCIYGHHCPSVVNGICMHPYCKFRTDEHPPGTKFKYPRTSDF